MPPKAKTKAPKVAKQRKSRTRDATPQILSDISAGSSLTEACAKHGLTCYAFLHFVNKDESLAHEYARAREIRADKTFEDLEELEDKVLDGKLDPNAYRVVLDSRKWRLGKMSPKYKDQKDINVNANLKVEYENELQRIQALAIDAEFTPLNSIPAQAIKSITQDSDIEED